MLYGTRVSVVKEGLGQRTGTSVEYGALYNFGRVDGSQEREGEAVEVEGTEDAGDKHKILRYLGKFTGSCLSRMYHRRSKEDNGQFAKQKLLLFVTKGGFYLINVIGLTSRPPRSRPLPYLFFR